MTNSELLAALRSWTGPLHMSLHVTACSLRVCTLLTNARHFTSQRASCTLPHYALYARYCTPCTLLHAMHATARYCTSQHAHCMLLHATARHSMLPARYCTSQHANARYCTSRHATARYCTSLHAPCTLLLCDSKSAMR